MPTATATKDKTNPRKRAVAKKVAPAPVPVPVRNGADRGQIQVRLPQDLIERLDIEADRRRVSKTFLVEQMIAAALPNWEAQEISAPPV